MNNNMYKKSMRSKKQAQMWGMDFMIGIFLFIIVLLISLKVLLSIYPSQSHITVYRDAVHISDILLSPGYPLNWTSDDVIIPGIAFNNRINKTKLSELKGMDYYREKTLLHTESDFVFFIRNSTTVFNITFANDSRCIYGYGINTTSDCMPDLDELDYENLVRIDRLVLYDSKVATLTIYAWN